MDLTEHNIKSHLHVLNEQNCFSFDPGNIMKEIISLIFPLICSDLKDNTLNSVFLIFCNQLVFSTID